MIAESSPIPWFSTASRRTRRIVVVAYWVVAVILLGIMQWAEAFRPGRLSDLSLLFPLYALSACGESRDATKNIPRRPR
ncbi:MAG: hypothetical protein ACP5E2_16020 [Terracidiphilus sp.]